MRLKREEFHKIRFKRGLSVQELSQAAGIQSETTYMALRRPTREIRWDTLLKLCEVLGCEPADIADLNVAGVGRE